MLPFYFDGVNKLCHQLRIEVERQKSDMSCFVISNGNPGPNGIEVLSSEMISTNLKPPVLEFLP